MLGGQMMIFEGGRMLQVGASGVRGTSNRDATITLIHKAWARLP